MHEPLKHEVRHERRGDDVVLRLALRRGDRPAQTLPKIAVPVPRHEHAVRSLAQLGARPANGIAIDDHDAPEMGPASLLGLGELPGVERPVAAATDDHHVAHDDRLAHA
ncbi:MAG: hypothetical protein DMD50_07205 [Gemmatimonadetes bacterium]|nr:MAG: hypothetical protein DMD50_07205 [Gemmatimonadota bacterium]